MKKLTGALALAAALTLASAVSCTATAGIPIELRLALEPLSDGAATTPTGWSVELTEATLLVGPIYAYAPLEEPMALRPPFGPALALAHGGFDPLDGRLVRGEYLDQLAFDALGGRVDLGAIDGLLGEVDELSVVLDEPRGANTSPDGPTHGHHAWVRGVATREGETVTFEGGIDIEDEGLLRRVDGVPVEGGALADGVTLVVGVDPSRWLSEANFTDLTGGVEVLGEDTQPHRAWRLGVRSAAAYSARTEGP
ncbi:MAG: hypothetical protein H6719_00425 [Sandaracinaceae bacterium]|nr:hypothetical protein [Sandaracinaceae bacterium]